MSNLPLQPLVWKDLNQGDVCVVRVDTPMYDYAIVNDSKAFKVGYYNLQSPIKYATGFATIDDAKAWAWNHYNEKMQPYVKPMPTWIDINERLPEEDGLYSVYYPSGIIKLQILFFSSNIKRFNLFHDSITHWMPLPELPASKESDCE